jgi:glycosyltransferase involved in cell wall biosynthesis
VDNEPAQVTVVIPSLLRTAQDLAWLDEALESVLDQTVPVEIIIAENGSEYFKDISGRVSIIHSDIGLSKARNAGISLVTTEFFFPLDCNDWMPENALEISLKKYPGEGFVYGSTMLFRYERGIGDQHLYDARPYDFREVMKMVYFTNGTLQKKADWETIGGYREDLPFLEDYDYWLTAGEKGICGTAISDVTYWYRQHTGMVASQKNTTEWEDMKMRIQSFHRDTFKGRFTPMCCGNKNQPSTPWVPPAQGALPPGAEGMVLIEYIGGNAGTMTFYGPVTNTRYRAGGVTKRLYIDSNDAYTYQKKTPGLLELSDHGTPIFKLVEEVPA